MNYFAVAMSENVIASSPIISGEDDVLTVIVWLQSHENHGSAMVNAMSKCRFNKKRYKQNTNGMWTQDGSFDMHISMLCSAGESETIPAINNRLTIVGAGKSILFHQVISSMRRDTFDESIMLALLYRFHVHD